jgi:glycosyltransferase involved in cell wall biosynthesis
LRPDPAQMLRANVNVERPLLYIWSGLGARFGYVTGVGKHAKNMGAQLLADPSWTARLVLARDQTPPATNWHNGTASAFARLPWNRAHIDAAWTLFHRPAAERWLEGPGWIYCPKEKYVPVRDLRYAVTVHDIYAFEAGHGRAGPAEHLRRRRFERMICEANIVFAVSVFTKRRLIDRFGLEAAKIVVVGNGVEEAYFAAAALDPEASRTDPEVDGPYVLFVGGLRNKKGAVDILRFADALAAADRSMRIVVVGPVDAEFEGEVAPRRNLRVIARGIADADMVRLVRGAKVAATLSAYEGFGIPLVEAMAAGVPVVAANRAALPEVVGDAGLLVDPADARGTAGLVCHLTRDEGLRETYVARGRCRAEQFRWSACAARVTQAMRAYDRGEPLC